MILSASFYLEAAFISLKINDSIEKTYRIVFTNLLVGSDKIEAVSGL